MLKQKYNILEGILTLGNSILGIILYKGVD